MQANAQRPPAPLADLELRFPSGTLLRAGGDRLRSRRCCSLPCRCRARSASEEEGRLSSRRLGLGSGIGGLGGCRESAPARIDRSSSRVTAKRRINAEAFPLPSVVLPNVVYPPALGARNQPHLLVEASPVRGRGGLRQRCPVAKSLQLRRKSVYGKPARWSHPCGSAPWAHQ